uniref:DUF1330 domain-containing protein n=1 Tax=Bursaphelenchus xylophilus TaxID=6326 RepID=A0A1I7RXC7_BURXY
MQNGTFLANGSGPPLLYGMVAQESQDPLAYFVQNPPNEVFNAAAKRNIHRVQARAVNTFKNCYFSPVQCVLLERRRRSVQV